MIEFQLQKLCIRRPHLKSEESQLEESIHKSIN